MILISNFRAIAGKVAVGDILEVTNAADTKLSQAGLRPNTGASFKEDLQVSLFWLLQTYIIYLVTCRELWINLRGRNLLTGVSLVPLL